MGRCGTRGSAIFSTASETRCGPSSLCGAKGRNGPGGEALKVFGGGAVMEIVALYDGNTWRAVYTVRFRDAVYVLHAFQEKSKRGVATPKNEIDLIRRRLAEAVRDYRERQN